MLIGLYEKYYQSPTLYNAKLLLDGIENEYDDLEDLAKLRLIYSENSSYADYSFISNGTTNQPRHFGFGPNGLFWRKQIESIVKHKDNFYVRLNMGIMSNNVFFNPVFFDSVISENIITSYTASIRFDIAGSIDFLMYNLDKLDRFSIFTWPNNWLYLLSRQEFREFIKTPKLQWLMSTDWECFCKRPPDGVKFNDNMVNWTTTMNFYTCSFGIKHFLPTFVPTSQGIVNLLNLAQPALCPTDDLMIISPDVHYCKCGRFYREFTFIPHVETTIRSKSGEFVYTTDLAESLKSSYMNLQFVQNGDIIDVLYITTDILPDTDIISEFFAKYGFGVRFIRNYYLVANRKMPVFFKSNGEQYRKFCWITKHF